MLKLENERAKKIAKKDCHVFALADETTGARIIDIVVYDEKGNVEVYSAIALSLANGKERISTNKDEKRPYRYSFASVTEFAENQELGQFLQ